ncbi:MAG: hypothetical protein LBQ94_09725 [Treponema sp.]|jgi:hypothetical protein|nr:hypothetical protein [Treponema sp.]
MTIEQTVEIPANHRLVIDVPREVPAGKATITFAPVSKDTDNDPLPTGECPICAAHNYMPNAKTIAVIEECEAMIRGEIPSTLREFDTVEEMWEDLDRDDPDDDLDDE